MSYALALLTAALNWIWTAEVFGHRVIQEAIFVLIVFSIIQILHILLAGLDDFPFPR